MVFFGKVSISIHLSNEDRRKQVSMGGYICALLLGEMNRDHSKQRGNMIKAHRGQTEFREKKGEIKATEKRDL